MDRDALRKASSAAKKSQKPAYTMCYKLISELFDIKTLASSRGQGLGKAKPDDFRPVLDRTLCSVLKGEHEHLRSLIVRPHQRDILFVGFLS